MTAAQDIAHFLATKVELGEALRVSEIAASPGCPVKPNPSWMTAGGEAHCQRITRALTQAVMAGLVERTRPAGRGPWYYRAATTPPDDTALQGRIDALIDLVRAQEPFVDAHYSGRPVPGHERVALTDARERVIDMGVEL